MSCLRQQIAWISLMLFMAFAGQMAVHAAEQAGWFCCGSTAECHQETETPGAPHTPFGGCCHPVLAILGSTADFAPPESSSIQYPPFTSLRPDGPVFEIEIPPQVG